MFYGMKRPHTLSEHDLYSIKYKIFINKKAPELCEFRGFPPCKM